MHDDLLPLQRLRDWLVRHPGDLIADDWKPTDGLLLTDLSDALYHSDGFVVYERRPGHYILRPYWAADGNPIGSRLLGVIMTAREWANSVPLSTAFVAECIDDILTKEAAKGGLHPDDRK